MFKSPELTNSEKNINVDTNENNKVEMFLIVNVITQQNVNDISYRLREILENFFMTGTKVCDDAIFIAIS